LHGSAGPAEALRNPNGARTDPAKAAPNRRNESRRDTGSVASDFENSSKCCDIDSAFRLARTSVHEDWRKPVLLKATVAAAAAFADAGVADVRRWADAAAASAVEHVRQVIGVRWANEVLTSAGMAHGVAFDPGIGWTAVAARSTVVEVAGEVRTVNAAACFQVAAARPAAATFRIVAAIEAAAGSADSPARLHARATGGETLLPLPLRTLIAEGPAGIGAARRGVPQPEWSEDGTGQGGAEQLHGLTTGNRFRRQCFGKLIKFICHDSRLSVETELELRSTSSA